MGILDIFKAKRSESVRLADLASWCAQEKKGLQEKASSELAPLAERLTRQIEDTRARLNHLRGSELQNKKITEREIQIMQGNREAYVNKTTHFLDQISASIPSNLQQIPPFLETFNKGFGLLVKGTQKSYYMVSEFFGNEAGEVANRIKAIEKTKLELASLMELASRDQEPLDRLSTALDDLASASHRQSVLKSELEKAEQKRKSLHSEIGQVEKELQKLQETVSYREYTRLKSDHEAAQLAVHDAEESIRLDFAPLEKALRKFAKSSQDELFIMDYLGSPASALASDQELYIMTVLDKLGSELTKGRLEVKDRVYDKTISQLEKLTKGYLAEQVARYQEAASKKALLEEELESNQAGLAFSELKIRKERLVAQLERLARQIEELKVEITKSSLESLKDQIKQISQTEFGLVVVD